MSQRPWKSRGRRAGVKVRSQEANTKHNIPVIVSSHAYQAERPYANFKAQRGVNLSNLIQLSKPKHLSVSPDSSKANKAQEANMKHNIPVIVSSHANQAERPYANFKAQRGVNLSNLIQLSKLKHLSDCPESSKANKAQLPHFLLVNARSLVPKIDELEALLKFNPSDFVAISESWLNGHIDTSLIGIPGFDLYRFDRQHGRGGGVCAYVSQEIPCKRRNDLEREAFECMWLWLRPYRLPRPLSGILVAVLYCPPDSSADNQRELVQHLIESIDWNSHPDCGLVILGDFNHLNVSDLLNQHNLKQLVNNPTRGQAVLDLVISNLKSHYTEPTVSAPLGTSDHNIIRWSPLSASTKPNNNRTTKCQLRRFPKSALDAFGRWVSQHNWFHNCGSSPSADSLASSFTSDITEAIDSFFPKKTVRLHSTDKPWITPSIKDLIAARQRAFSSGDRNQWRHLRGIVRSAISSRKKSFYSNKVQHLKHSDPSKWWKLVGKLSGKPSSSPPLTLVKEGKIIKGTDLANLINNNFLNVASDLPPLNTADLPVYLPMPEPPPTILEPDVCKQLLKVNALKANGPDGIPNRVIKDFAHELSAPVTTIFNASLSTGIVPSIWKDSFISPVPKVQPVTCEDELRPIALTSSLSKVLEDFVVKWMIHDLHLHIDPKQFGCLKGTSTTYCLLDLIHNWLSALDTPAQFLRVCFLDFSKAFDRINHNIVILKLLDLGVRECIIPRICSFLPVKP